MQRNVLGRWKLMVRYPTGGEGYHWGALDPEIVDAVGGLDDGSGTTLDGAVRWLMFRFGSEGPARKARQRVLNLHKRGVRTEVSR